MKRITRFDNQGRGIAFDDKKTLFIANALPGEEVEYRIIHENSKISEAISTKIASPNPHRVQPKCPYYNICGGCNIMHMSAELQQEFKKEKVANILKKFADIDWNIRLITSGHQLFYRNKITLKVRNGKWGYFESLSHQFCGISTCLIATNDINNDLKYKEFISLNNGEVVIRSNSNHEVLMSVTTEDDIKIDYNSIPENIIGIVGNSKTLYGKNYFIETIDRYRFKVSYDAFFQVNNYGLKMIFEILANNVRGINLLDLYCGVGVLGISLKDNFQNIVGIEITENAVIDAVENAKMNDVKAKYYAGDTGEILKSLEMNFDTILVDPPRSGLNRLTIDTIINLNPDNIAYVSCDPMTLARDLKILKEYYEPIKIYAIDLFPNTYHVETVVILKRKVDEESTIEYERSFIPKR